MSVCAVIPSLPTRQQFLGRAVSSVLNQEEHPVTDLAVALDHHRQGAWVTRNRAARQACATSAEWVGFLDDDDRWKPHHCRVLLDAAQASGADVVWGWFDVVGGGDPFPHYRGRQYNPDQPHIVPITYLVRRALLAQALDDMGGFQPDEAGAWDNQDQPLLDYFYQHGSGMYAVNDITWWWHHHGNNTSGLPTRGK